MFIERFPIWCKPYPKLLARGPDSKEDLKGGIQRAREAVRACQATRAYDQQKIAGTRAGGALLRFVLCSFSRRKESSDVMTRMGKRLPSPSML